MASEQKFDVEVGKELDFNTRHTTYESSVTIPSEVMNDATTNEAIRGAVVEAARRQAESVLYTWKVGDGRVRIVTRFSCAEPTHEHTK